MKGQRRNPSLLGPQPDTVFLLVLRATSQKSTNSWFNISGSGLCGACRSARDQGGSVVSTPRLWPRGSLASAGREGKWLPVQIRSIVRASAGGKAPVLEYSSQCLGHFLNDIQVSASSVLAASSVLNSGSCRGQG